MHHSDMQRAPGSLEARDVTCAYGTTTAVDGVSLVIPAGACIALVGESGSGKTTLLRCFNRMVDPTAGGILVDEQPVSTLSPESLRRSIGYVPQHGGLMPHWRVLRNVALVPTLLGVTNASKRAADALDRVGLSADEFGHRFPHELSGGQRQRVALARAIAGKPRILLLDEAFGALDAITRAQVQASFAAMRSELNVTTLLVTHDLAEAALLADRIAVMRRGNIEQCGTISDLRHRPTTPYVARLIEQALGTQRKLLEVS